MGTRGVIVAAGAWVLAACAGATEAPATGNPAAQPSTAAATQATTSAGELPLVDPSQVTGDIVAAGSSTVFPLAERLAERFRQEGYDGTLTIDSAGTGAGFERFCSAGETDISTASRPITAEETAACTAIGRTPVELRIGTDALAISVSADNAFLADLSLMILPTVFATSTTWADVDPAWPSQPIQRFIPGTDSGTFNYFVEKVYHKDKAPILAASNLQLSEDDNVLVQGIEGSPYAVGFFGFAYYKENTSRLKVVSIDGITPDAATVEGGTYPLSRPLFLYTDPKVLAGKPQVGAFLAYFLTHVNEEIADVGYFPAGEAVLGQAATALKTAMTGQ